MTAQARDRSIKAHERATANEQNTTNGKLNSFNSMVDVLPPKPQQSILCVLQFCAVDKYDTLLSRFNVEITGL